MGEWSTDTRDLVAATIAAHVDIIDGSNATPVLTCSGCDHLAELPEDGDWDPLIAEFEAHRADAVLTALAEAGALLPTDGETTQHFGFDVDGHDRPVRCPYEVGTCIALEYGPYKHEHRYTQQRRSWPDGSVYYGPWREVPDA